MDSLIPVGSKVRILFSVSKGIVRGYGFVDNRVVYLVELNKGQYLEDRSSFISTIIVANNNLELE